MIIWSSWVINSLVNNFSFHLLINEKQLTSITSEKKKNEIVFLDVSLQKEEADSSNTPENFYQNTWLHLPEDNVHTHCHEKFKSGNITHLLLAWMHPPPPLHTHTYTLLRTANYKNVLYWECIDFKKIFVTHIHTYLNYTWVYKRFYPLKWLFEVQTEKNMQYNSWNLLTEIHCFKSFVSEGYRDGLQNTCNSAQNWCRWWLPVKVLRSSWHETSKSCT